MRLRLVSLFLLPMLAPSVACDRRTAPIREAGSDDASASSAAEKEEKKPKKRFGPRRVEQLVAYGEHRCARLDDGTVRCWGQNDNVFHADDIFFSAPKIIPNLENVTSIATGNKHTCVIADEKATCWGGGVAKINSPSHVTEIATGDDRTCAVTLFDGVHCWGRSPFAMSEHDKSDTPVRRSELGRLQGFVLGKDMSCARRSGTDNGQPECWGRFTVLPSNPNAPVAQHTVVVAMGVKVGGVGQVRDLAIDRDDACAVNDDGALFCWKPELREVAGQGTAAIKATRIVGPPPLGEIELTEQGPCALLANGGVRCWEGTPPKGPGTPVPNTDDALELAGTCIRTNEGKVLCWGKNDRGQLGIGESHEQFAAVTVPALSDVTGIALGNRHTCALKKDGSIACWGDNAGGGVDPQNTRRPYISIPTVVKGIDDVLEISAGKGNTCVLRRDRKVTCWGWSYPTDDVRPGGDDKQVARRPLVRIAGLTEVSHLTSAGEGSCALRTDGSVWCWGELGGKKLPTPTALAGMEGIVELSMTRQFAIGRTTAGKVVAYGFVTAFDKTASWDNHAYTLPDVQDATRVTATGAWSDTACFITKTQPLRCVSSKPELPVALAKPEALAKLAMLDSGTVTVGDSFVCGIAQAQGAQGGVRCLPGSNQAPFIGTPGCPKNVHNDAGCEIAKLDGGGGVAEISVGESHACALMRDGTVRCWGSDMSAQLGIGHVLESREARPVTFE